MAQLVYIECLPSHRTLRVRIPPEAALLEKGELSSGVPVLLCLISMTDHSCISLLSDFTSPSLITSRRVFPALAIEYRVETAPLSPHVSYL